MSKEHAGHSKHHTSPYNSHYHTTALISHASKEMLKLLQATLQQCMNQEPSDVQAGFKKAEEPEIKLPTFIGSQIKQRSFRKTSVFPSLTVLKPLCGSQQTVENS